MATFLYKTKGNADPKGKPRVYFTCHPADFERYFTKIWEDISATHDVALYYTEDMAEDLDREHMETDLGQMNLFVVPVTWRLLSQPNRAMDADISYAKQENIPILPFMMEQGIDEFYSKPEKFGKRQYLAPYASDLTAIRYEEKLKKYLESVLISDELAQRVRAAFDAYIFLSYRKKDRKYANELMKLIHKNPECRDIAIWYDEFLTPGESFAENIQKALENSKLFTLLVTPNLLEEPDGKPNFVMAEEYPAAAKAEKTVLPAEMVRTDHDTLAAKFPSIPDCADPQDEAAFKERLLQSLQKIAISANNDDPEHNFLIGLAYLDGIDVEVNRDRGVELITLAAEANLLEAMKKLYALYGNLSAAEYDYRQQIKWAERIVAYNSEKFGEEHPETLNALSNLATIGQLDTALIEKVYTMRRKVLGEEHLDTLDSLDYLANTYYDLNQRDKALEEFDKLYTMRRKVLGEEHPDTQRTLYMLSYTCGELGKHKKSQELWEKLYILRCKVLGDEHQDTLSILHTLACSYEKLGQYVKAQELYEKAYFLRCRVLGEGHPKTLMSLNELACCHGKLRQYEKALELHGKGYELKRKNWGEDNKATLTSLNNLAQSHYELGQYEKALKLHEKAYFLRCRVLGEKHRDTVLSLHNLAYTYHKLGQHDKSLELFERLYTIQCKMLGAEHQDTLASLNNLAFTYDELGQYERARELYEKVYLLRCNVLGEEHQKTLISLNNLAYSYGELGQYEKSLELFEKGYELWRRKLGDEHPRTLISINNLAYIYDKLRRYKESMELWEKLYFLRSKVQGEAHADTQQAKKSLAAARKKLEETT